MPLTRRAFIWVLTVCAAASAEPLVSGASERREAIARAGVLGSVLMIGAHPDDEHNATLAYLARGRLVRTAYLSLTRGEGGQNLIGPEQGAMLGVIRTQELLAARAVDGAEQYFTRAIDFGFSKSAGETLAKWGREEVLGDIVWVIRSFRPDVVLLCFSGAARDGHGHHQASGILGKEAFAAAADPKRFPEQLKYVRAWQAKRLVWNVYGGVSQPDYRIEAGEWNPVIGYSYGELAGLGRSMHRSQGMGGPPRRGPAPINLVNVAGDRGSDLFDGIDTSWARIPGGGEVGRLIASALENLDDEHPERVIPALLAARARAAALDDPWAAFKLREIDEAIVLCSGLWLDASADRWDVVPGSQVRITATALKRAPVEATLTGAIMQWGGRGMVNVERAPLGASPVTRQFVCDVPAGEPFSGPYWLEKPSKNGAYAPTDPRLTGAAETPPVATVRFRLQFGESDIEIVRPVIHRYIDRSRGELTRPVVVVPAVALQWAEPALIFPDDRPRPVRLIVKANAAASGEVRLNAPAGWKIDPVSVSFEAAGAGQEMPVVFTVTPGTGARTSTFRAIATAGGREVSSGMDVISYPHFPAQVVLRPAEIAAARADVKVLAKRVGYVMGAGDNVPESLAQLGLDVRLLGADDLAKADLSGFDAIVTGVRAYNVRADLRANQRRLMDYVERGGTVIVQYNVMDGRTSTDQLANLGPFLFRVGRDRVAVEDVPVEVTEPASPLLTSPNRIIPQDFDDWVQERGLYFASDWDPRYHTLLSCSDPGEPARAGGMLYAKYGRGAYVFTAYAWFRQLPAGVPGAFRIFANLLSAGKTLQ